MNLTRQNFHEEVEAGINKQINIELRSAYIYQSMSSYYNRDDVALPGFSKYFGKSAKQEREHAEKLTSYMTLRGGRVVYLDINKPEKNEWNSGIEGIQAALDLEKDVNKSLLSLHEVSQARRDAHFSDYLEKEFLEDRINSIRELGEMLTKLSKAGNGLGEYIFDKDLQ